MKKTCLTCGEPNTSANEYFCIVCMEKHAWHEIDEIEKLASPPVMLKDSGARREFESGAVRDISDGKGRCDLLPLSVVADLLQVQELHYIEDFKRTKNPGCLYKAIRLFCEGNYSEHPIPATMIGILEVSKHYEDGARKYSENNWMKGLPVHCFIDSGVRHLLKHLRGDKDEPHDRAFIWNMLGAVWTLCNKPELWDLLQGLDEEDL